MNTGSCVYPAPDDNPECRCRSPVKAFFCSTGHLTECHYSLTCEEAECRDLKLYREAADRYGWGDSSGLG